jgi:hypothetical protein
VGRPLPYGRGSDRSRARKQAVGALICLALAAHAEIIDRIAVSVGNRVITQSDLERQIRVVALQNGKKPDFTSANKRAVAEKMIEQKLIQRELENSRYPVPTPDDLVPAIEEFKKTHFPDVAAYHSALAAADITEQDLLDVLIWERTLLNFIEIRFESGVLAGEQEIAEYVRANNVTPAQAERALVASRADRQLDDWLRTTRGRTTVITHEEVLR